MTAVTAPPEAPAFWSIRAYGLALLPLALLGLMPTWLVLTLCGLYALGVRYSRWAEARLLISLLLVSMAALLGIPGARSAGLAGVTLLGTQFMLWLACAAALNWTASEVQDGRSRRALLPVALLGLLAPQPLLLLALAGGLLARPGPDDRLSGAVTRQAGWGWMAAALLVSLLLAALLPRTNGFWLTTGLGTPLPTGKTVTPDPAAAPPRAVNSGTGTVFELPLQMQLDVQQLALPLALFGLAGGALLLAALILFRPQGPLRTGRRPSLPEILMGVALLVTAVTWLIMAIFLNGGGTGGAGRSAAAGLRPPPETAVLEAAPSRQLNITPVAQSMFWVGLLGTVALLVIGLLFLRRVNPAAPQAALSGPAAAPESAAPEALHRVRAAYREAELALSDSGRGRASTETPATYAARLSGQDPALAGPLDTLTRAYAPVRYGGRVSDDDADDAEAALDDLRRLLLTLPRLQPGEDPDTPDPKETP